MPTSGFEDEPTDVIPQLQSGHVLLEKQNGSQELNACNSLLNDSPRQQEDRTETVVAKESLADWGVVVCVFLSNLISALDFAGFGVFYPYLVEHFETTTAAVAWCSSFSGFFYAITALFASYPIQYYGCRLPCVVGCLLRFVAVSLSSFAPNLTTMYFTYGVISGSGAGLAILSTNIIILQRFTRNRNLASGIGYIGYSLGSMIGPILANQFIQLYSWRGAFLVLGALQAQRIPLVMFFRTPDRLISGSKQNSDTSPKRITGQGILKYIKETFNFSILRHARYSVYTIAHFLHSLCLLGYWQHTVNRAINVGLSRDQGANAAALIGVASTVSRLFVSFIVNHRKVNSSLVFATGMFFVPLSIVAIFINPGIIGTMTSTALFGAYIGSSTTVITIVAVDLMGVAMLSKSLAILQFTGGLGVLVSSPLVGWVFDLTRDYNKAFAISGCTAFVSGSIMVALTVVIRCQRKSVAKDIELSSLEKISPKSTQIESTQA